jgi:eukaryotic-like serine/threonine-protein kinase
MPLNPRRVQAVFLEAADYHDPADRASILDRECPDDPQLRGRVEALLRAHDEFNSFLNDPAGSARRDFWRSNDPSSRRGPG